MAPSEVVYENIVGTEEIAGYQNFLYLFQSLVPLQIISSSQPEQDSIC